MKSPSPFYMKHDCSYYQEAKDHVKAQNIHRNEFPQQSIGNNPLQVLLSAPIINKIGVRIYWFKTANKRHGKSLSNSGPRCTKHCATESVHYYQRDFSDSQLLTLFFPCFPSLIQTYFYIIQTVFHFIATTQNNPVSVQGQ